MLYHSHPPEHIVTPSCLLLSAFFWLLALLFSSILYTAVVQLQDKLAFGLVFSVLFQELFRYIYECEQISVPSRQMFSFLELMSNFECAEN